MKIIDYYITHEKLFIVFEKKYGMMDLFDYIAWEGNLNEKMARKLYNYTLHKSFTWRYKRRKCTYSYRKSKCKTYKF